MPDYIYLLENRLSADQQNALRCLREVAREAGTILFLTGDAVRDLTSGHSVHDLEVVLHGNALKLKKTIEKSGGKVWGEDEDSRSLYLCFPGTVRVDLVSAHRVDLAKPGKPVYHFSSIQEDLRRRDFTVNAMAISLNEGSFGLLMDPMNGAADIESRTLRLVSNYGFLEDASLLIRATRYQTRLGWELDPKTHTRYDNAVEAGVMAHLTATARSRELEQIGHEEEALKVLQALDAAGWMKVLFPAWTPAKADQEKLTALHDLSVELLLQGVHSDMSAAQMRLLTAKLAPKDLAALKKQMLRPGFVEEWDHLDMLAAGFAKVLLSKANQLPSACFKLFTSYDPEAVLWLGFTGKDAAVKERFNQFLKVWPEARQRIPHALMQEMRITAELPAYAAIIESVFLELIDGKLGTPEEARAYLEPHSPPAPPPQVTIKRPRVKRGAESKIKEDSYDDDDDKHDEHLEDDEDLDDIGGDDDELDLGLATPQADREAGGMDESDMDEDEERDVPRKPTAKSSSKPSPKLSPVKSVAQPAVLPKPAAPPIAAPKVAKSAAPKPSQKTAQKPASTSTVKPASARPAPASKAKPTLAPAKKRVLPLKPAPKKAPAKVPRKAVHKASVKVHGKAPAKPTQKPATKAPLKRPVTPLAKPAAKKQSQARPKVQAKPLAKAAAKRPVSKSVPAKKKPIAAASHKLHKVARPSKPVAKKPTSRSGSRPGKKR